MKGDRTLLNDLVVSPRKRHLIQFSEQRAQSERDTTHETFTGLRIFCGVDGERARERKKAALSARDERDEGRSYRRSGTTRGRETDRLRPKHAEATTQGGDPQAFSISAQSSQRRLRSRSRDFSEEIPTWQTNKRKKKRRLIKGS